MIKNTTKWSHVLEIPYIFHLFIYHHQERIDIANYAFVDDVHPCLSAHCPCGRFGMVFCEACRINGIAVHNLAYTSGYPVAQAILHETIPMQKPSRSTNGPPESPMHAPKTHILYYHICSVKGSPINASLPLPSGLRVQTVSAWTKMERGPCLSLHCCRGMVRVAFHCNTLGRP